MYVVGIRITGLNPYLNYAKKGAGIVERCYLFSRVHTSKSKEGGNGRCLGKVPGCSSGHHGNKRNSDLTGMSSTDGGGA